MFAASTVGLLAILATEATTRIKLEPKNASEFYQLYKSYELWLPMPDAKLVRNGAGDDETFHILPSPVRDKGRVMVRGWYGELEGYRISELHQAEFSVATIEKAVWRGAQDLLFLAAVGQHLGRTEFATAAFEKARKTAGYLTQIADWEKDAPGFTSGLLRERVWSLNLDQLADVHGDRKRAYRHLKRVHDEDARFRWPPKDALVQDLELTLRPKVPAHDPIEQKIDRLAEWSGEPRGGFRYRPRVSDPVGPCEEILKHGFDAVPYLIAHLDDKRLTRSQQTFVFNLSFWADIYRVGDVCQDMLRGLSGYELIDPDKSWTVDDWRTKAKTWFEEAKTVGEEKWYASKAMTKNPVNSVMCRAFAERYPNRFASCYKTLLAESPEVYSGVVVMSLVHARLSREEKIELLTVAATHKRLEHRLDAIQGLAFLDPVAGRRHLPAYFERMTEKEAGDRYESILQDEMNVVMALDDDKCWTAFKAHLRKCSANQRVYYIGSSAADLQHHPAKERKRWFHEIEALWNDPTERLVEKDKNLSDFAKDYLWLTVGDFITLTFADALDIEIPLDRNRSPADWKKLREKVQAALAEDRKK